MSVRLRDIESYKEGEHSELDMIILKWLKDFLNSQLEIDGYDKQAIKSLLEYFDSYE